MQRDNFKVLFSENSIFSNRIFLAVFPKSIADITKSFSDGAGSSIIIGSDVITCVPVHPCRTGRIGHQMLSGKSCPLES